MAKKSMMRRRNGKPMADGVTVAPVRSAIARCRYCQVLLLSSVTPATLGGGCKSEGGPWSCARKRAK